MIFAKKILIVIGLLICNMLSAQNQFFYATLYQDKDALSFINNAGITGGKNINAIFYLVTELKRKGLWSKFYAIYPMVGGNANSHSYNLKDPRNSSLALKLQFNGGWTHNDVGANPNGIDAWANTFSGNLFMTLYTGNLSFGYYSQSNVNNLNNKSFEMGFEFAPGVQFGDSSFTTGLAIKQGPSISPISDRNISEGSIAGTVNDNRARTTLINDFSGFFIVNCRSTNEVKLFQNGQLIIASNNPHQSFSVANIYIGAINRVTGPNSSIASNFSNRTCSFAYISSGLSDEEVWVFNNIVATYMSKLRLDVDAMNFAAATNIQNNSHLIALNRLVVDLKGSGLWNKLTVVYPMIGGTSETHRFNLKDARNTNQANRLDFFGGWSHSTTGALPNGVNAYANTYFNPATSSNTNNISLGVYSGTNIAPTTTADYEMGVYDATNALMLGYSNTSMFMRANSPITPITTISYASRPTTGLWVLNRISQTQVRAYNNTTILGTANNTSGAPPNGQLYIASRNNNGSPQFYSNREIRFAFIGQTLTDAEVTTLYNIVHQFQSDLGRAL
ncbi:MAG TPA: hypothetical protein DCQ29_00905 [Chitinophagaceae bacterium]|nr:hypothetical protein [Chitinophagaceae bacterium]